MFRGVPAGPNSNPGAGSTIRWVAVTWGSRALAFRNEKRSDRLLKLVVFARRGSYDERGWAAVIDKAAAERGGRTAAALRTVSDKGGKVSL